MELGTQIKIAAMIVHADEYMDTGEGFDLNTFKSMLGLPDVQAWLCSMEKQCFLPLRRDGKKYSQEPTP
jgi:hypothetical protein